MCLWPIESYGGQSSCTSRSPTVSVSLSEWPDKSLANGLAASDGNRAVVAGVDDPIMVVGVAAYVTGGLTITVGVITTAGGFTFSFAGGSLLMGDSASGT